LDYYFCTLDHVTCDKFLKILKLFTLHDRRFYLSAPLFISVYTGLKCCPSPLDTIRIPVLPRNFRNSSLFIVTCEDVRPINVFRLLTMWKRRRYLQETRYFCNIFCAMHVTFLYRLHHHQQLTFSRLRVFTVALILYCFLSVILFCFAGLMFCFVYFYCFGLYLCLCVGFIISICAGRIAVY
jgi:hypothetical protein